MTGNFVVSLVDEELGFLFLNKGKPYEGGCDETLLDEVRVFKREF